MNMNTIWTIGHSTHPLADFIKILQSFKIEVIVDIRSFPGSNKFPQYNKEAFKLSLAGMSINYIHLPILGGRRKVIADSKNTAWKNASFRGYAYYMHTESFKEGIIELEHIVFEKLTAYMCSEAVWWRCHRSMVSDYLKVGNWRVMHIMAIDKAQEHPFTQPAKIINGKLNYEKE